MEKPEKEVLMKQLTVVLLCLFIGFHANAVDKTTQTEASNVATSKSEIAKKAVVVTTSKPATTVKKAVVVTTPKPATTVKKAAVVTTSKPATTVKKAVVVTTSKPATTVKKAVVVTTSKPATTVKKAVVVTTSKPATAAKKTAVVTASKSTATVETSVATPSKPEVAAAITESHINHSMEQPTEKTAFFSLHLINEFAPLDYLRYERFALSLGFGGEVLRQSAFELSIRFTRGAFFTTKYEQDFTRKYRWIPGFDASFLLGAKYNNKGPRESWGKYLTLGLEGGLYVKTFITKSYAILTRTGLNYEVPVNTSNLLDLEPTIYVSIGLKKHFK